jgi:hypothetical protein
MEVNDYFFNSKPEVLLSRTHTLVNVHGLLVLLSKEATFLFDLSDPLLVECQIVLTV